MGKKINLYIDKLLECLPTTKLTNNNTTSGFDRFPFFLRQASFTHEKSKSYTPQYDLDDYVIFFQLSGISQVLINKEIHYMQAFECLFISCKKQISIKSVKKNNFMCFEAIISGNSVHIFYNMIRQHKNIFQILPQSDFFNTFYNIITFSNNDAVFYNMKMCLEINKLLLSLYNVSSEILNIKKIIPIKTSEIEQAKKYIDENYHKEITLNDICSNVYLSKNYLCNAFYDKFGVTVKSYLNSVRIDKAKNLLLFSKQTVLSIGNQVGYTQTLTFIRNFKKFTNMTPLEYRNNF